MEQLSQMNSQKQLKKLELLFQLSKIWIHFSAFMTRMRVVHFPTKNSLHLYIKDLRLLPLEKVELELLKSYQKP